MQSLSWTNECWVRLTFFSLCVMCVISPRIDVHISVLAASLEKGRRKGNNASRCLYIYFYAFRYDDLFDSMQGYVDNGVIVWKCWFICRAVEALYASSLLSRTTLPRRNCSRMKLPCISSAPLIPSSLEGLDRYIHWSNHPWACHKAMMVWPHGYDRIGHPEWTEFLREKFPGGFQCFALKKNRTVD